jgi:hypothetical protein
MYPPMLTTLDPHAFAETGGGDVVPTTLDGAHPEIRTTANTSARIVTNTQ